MHWPDCALPGRSNRDVRAETWRALEEMYDEGGGACLTIRLAFGQGGEWRVSVPSTMRIKGILGMFFCLDRIVPFHRHEQLPDPTSGGAEGGQRCDASRQPGTHEGQEAGSLTTVSME